ncbi:tetratricopeptide repeat protein [Flavicella sediminum]|uniref:tetratricopeptide repeat protein n=1 Tax=Flavicella sediminum TaxID=2585141 RepID=UPI001122129A|nr:tetratricopeptide repeat protein [Flavicella sediminum]
MATYKKKGQKKVKNEPVQEVEEESTTAEVFNTLDETASKSEEWVEKNQKPLFSGLIAIAVVILGYLAYTTYVTEPKEIDAANELAFPKESFDLAAESNSAADSLFTVALEGANGKYGFLDIAKKYAGTNAGNLANYYAGISYLKTKQYKSAIEYLGKFSSDDALLGPVALGAIGDAFADLNQLEDALSYYEKAANASSNLASTPLFLLKAGNTALELGKADQAEKLFTEIKTNYSKSSLANNIELSINKAKYAK